MQSKTFLIGIAGGTSSGKTQLSKNLFTVLGQQDSAVLSLDWYFLTGLTNNDHPSAIKFPLLKEHIDSLTKGIPAEVPIYYRHIDTEPSEVRLITPAKYLIVEGIFTLWEKELRDTFSLKIFLDIDDDVRVIRRVLRDVVEYNLDLEEVCQYYLETVRPMHDLYVEPTKKHADLIIDDLIPIDQQTDIIIKEIRQREVLRSK